MVRTVALCAGVAVALLASAAAAAGESALAVVVDLPALGLALAVAAASLAGVGLWLSAPAARVAHRVGGTTVAVSIGVAAVLVYTLWVTHRTESIAFESAGAALEGTLYLPRGAHPRVSVVLVHGSGAQTRREHRFYARWLASRGVPALAYDKRGTGASTGVLYETTYHGYAEDAAAAIRALETHPSIGSGCVGIVGFSEAEWVAPIVASPQSGPAFIAVVGASGLTPADQVQAEIAERLERRGFSREDIDAALGLNERVLEYQRTGKGAEDLRGHLAQAHSEPWFAAAEDIPSDAYPWDDYRWWRSVMDFDPAPYWARTSVPVLLLKGERDDRSSPDIMERRIAAALGPGARERLTTVVVPDADHMLLVWPYGPATPPPSFAEGALDTLLDWIRRHAPQACAPR